MKLYRSRERSRASCWFIALVVLGHIANCHAQLSKPVAHDSHWHQQDNKFLQRKAENDKEDDQQQFDDVVGTNICPLDVELKWMTEISSSVYATPLITDLYADGRKDIIVPGFVHYTEVLEGPDGAKALGWPGFHKSTVHSSPLLYDIDSDGIRDILVATYDGEIIFFKDNGEQLPQRMQVPRLRVRKNWHVGVNPDPVDHSHPDVGAMEGKNSPFEKAVHGGKQEVHKQQATKAAAAAATSPAAASSPQQQPAQQQQQQQQQHAAATPAGSVTQPTVQPPPQQQAQQPQPQPQQQAQPQQQQQQQQTQPQAPATKPLDVADQAAALKYWKHLQDYAKEFGQASADDMLNKVKTSNPAMYNAVMDLKQKSQQAKAAELEAIMHKFNSGQQQQQQQQPAVAGGQAGGAPHQRRRLMSASDAEQVGSSGGVASGMLFGPGRHLLQGGAAAAAEHAAAAAGVEPDPNHKPLTQEAIDSFKVFEDDSTGAAAGGGKEAAAATGASGTAGSNAAASDRPPVQQEPEDAYEAAAAQGDSAGQEHEAKSDTPYPYPDMYNTEYDEFGEKVGGGDAAHGQPSAGDAAAAGVQQPADQQKLRDWHDDAYGGRWRDSMWEDEMFLQSAHNGDNEYVFVDAHILCTPAIADIDDDGHDELVVAVSYFYDKEYYDDPAHAHELSGVDKDKYVAGGIIVFDLRTRFQKWQQHLDLTTSTTKFTAHMFSSPTLVDIDADGKMEIVVGTSVGFVYVLDHKGSSRPGWPIQMGEVQGQVLVADLNADGAVELFAGDTLGNIALLDIHGKELWERHVKSMITQGAVAGDIDGDGLLEIVFGTADGHVHAVRGTDGRPLPNFPFQTGGRIQAPATITHLKKGSHHQHIMIMSFDGFLYLIDGKNGCAHTVDIGEASYSSVLVDDLCGDGLLELLVSTMNGNVYMLQTQMPYHPAKTWTAQVQGINGLVSRWGYFGFVATQDGRQLRDVAGQQLQVQVELWDERTILENGMPVEDPPHGPYNITVMLKGVGVAEMNAGSQPVIGVSDVLDKPGKAVIEIPCPRTRTTAAVHLDVITKHGLHFEDEFVVSFHMHFHKLLKWLIALPLLVMAAVVIVVGQTLGFDAGKSYHLG